MRCFMRARREKADVRPGHGGSVSRTTNSEDCGEAHVVPYLVGGKVPRLVPVHTVM